MEASTNYQPDSEGVRITIDPGESLLVRPEFIIAILGEVLCNEPMDQNQDQGIKAKASRFLKNALVSFGSRKQIKTVLLSCRNQPAEILLSPVFSGDAKKISIDSESVILREEGFIACTDDVNISRFQVKEAAVFDQEGHGFIEVAGRGMLWFSGNGALTETQSTAGLIVNAEHIVGFDSSLTYEISRENAYKASVTSGGGLAVQFTGNGRLWLQSKSLSAISQWFLPQLPE